MHILILWYRHLNVRENICNDLNPNSRTVYYMKIAESWFIAVLSTLKQPFPGWIDNVYTGGFAFIAGTGAGVFRVSCADHRRLADIVPCDQVVNLMMAAAWRAGIETWVFKGIVYQADTVFSDRVINLK